MSAVDGAIPTTPTTVDRLTLGGGVGFGATPDAQEEQEMSPAAIPPQARVQPPSVPVRGVPAIDMPAAPAGGQAPPPQLAAAEMYRQLFPFG